MVKQRLEGRPGPAKIVGISAECAEWGVSFDQHQIPIEDRESILEEVEPRSEQSLAIAPGRSLHRTFRAVTDLMLHLQLRKSYF